MRGRRGSPGTAAQALTLRNTVQAAHDRASVAHECLWVEDRVQVELGRRLRQQVTELGALVPGALGGLLNGAVGVVARAARLHEGEQRALRVERAVRGVQVLAHAL